VSHTYIVFLHTDISTELKMGVFQVVLLLMLLSDASSSSAPGEFIISLR